MAFILLQAPLMVGAETILLTEGIDGYSGTSDTSIFEERPGNAGGGTFGIFSGTIVQGTIRRALIRFDLEGILPDSATITAAELMLTVTRARADAPDTGFGIGNGQYTLHRVEVPWGEGAVIGDSMGGFGAPAQEGDATWVSRFHADTPWQQAGGDFVSEASASDVVSGTNDVAVWSGAGMVADIALWHENPEMNHGWLIRAVSEGAAPGDVKRFGSAENSNFSVRPVLMITFETADQPGPADIDSSGMVDAVDVQLVINAALSIEIGDLNADVNNDDVVDAVDIQTVINTVLGL